MGYVRGFVNGEYSPLGSWVKEHVRVFRYLGQWECFASLLERLDSPGLRRGSVLGCYGLGRHRVIDLHCRETETATMGEETGFCLLSGARVYEGEFVACRKDRDRNHILDSEKEGFENGADNPVASGFAGDRTRLGQMVPRYPHAEGDFVVVNVGDYRIREKVIAQAGRLADNFLLHDGLQICRDS